MQKRIILGIRVDEMEKQQLQHVADVERQTLSELVREVLRHWMRENHVWPPRGDKNAAS